MRDWRLKRMKERLLPLLDKLLLRKRGIVESITDQLKNISLDGSIRAIAVPTTSLSIC